MSEKDQANPLAILDSANKVLRFTQDTLDADAFYSDTKTFDAVLMNFVVIGESVAKLSQKTKEANEHVSWVKIKGFRNIVAHNYFGVDAEDVWQTIQHHIPALVEDIKNIFDSEK